ncbi:MAG: alcohol dehydrogenase catalytic domain-containing protein, partial [Oscillospiraceae bacterium]|nr:alcohol dehydrogenase catalytic domain-containing protein [Oscillospiraceae bacterium]
MRALLRQSDTPRDFCLGAAEEPQIQPGLVKIKVAYAGICGSDLHIYLGQDPGLPQP